MSKQLEKKIEDEIVNHVEELGGKAYKLRIDGRNGFPDRTVLIPGCPDLFIEVKRLGEKPSDVQLEVIRDLADLNRHVYVVDTFEDFKAIVNRHLKGRLPTVPVYRRCFLNWL